MCKNESTINSINQDDKIITMTVNCCDEKAELVHGVLNEEVISRVNDYLDEQSEEITKLKKYASKEAIDAERKINNDYSGITL